MNDPAAVPVIRTEYGPTGPAWVVVPQIIDFVDATEELRRRQDQTFISGLPVRGEITFSLKWVPEPKTAPVHADRARWTMIVNDLLGEAQFEIRRILISWDHHLHRPDWEDELIDTVLHECAHAILGRGGHGRKFWRLHRALMEGRTDRR